MKAQLIQGFKTRFANPDRRLQNIVPRNSPPALSDSLNGRAGSRLPISTAAR